LSTFFRHLLAFLVHLGYFGPFLLGVMDASFLFLPFGNDLLIVGLVARHHAGYVLYVAAAVCGCVVGVSLLDLVARKLGEEGIQKMAGERRFEKLKRKMSEKGGRALAVACLAPPPFPFTMVIAINSALDYPRKRLLAIVAGTRAVRFLILGALAIKFGSAILRIAKSTPFKWTMIVFILLCIAGSALSVMKWLKRGRPAKPGQKKHVA
jgi:membrane protein YqaA with SNARE-associated domain